VEKKVTRSVSVQKLGRVVAEPASLVDKKGIQSVTVQKVEEAEEEAEDEEAVEAVAHLVPVLVVGKKDIQSGIVLKEVVERLEIEPATDVEKKVIRGVIVQKEVVLEVAEEVVVVGLVVVVVVVVVVGLVVVVVGDLEAAVVVVVVGLVVVAEEAVVVDLEVAAEEVVEEEGAEGGEVEGIRLQFLLKAV